MIINYYSTFLVYIYKYIQNDLVALVVNYCSFLLRITTKKNTETWWGLNNWAPFGEPTSTRCWCQSKPRKDYKGRATCDGSQTEMVPMQFSLRRLRSVKDHHFTKCCNVSIIFRHSLRCLRVTFRQIMTRSQELTFWRHSESIGCLVEWSQEDLTSTHYLALTPSSACPWRL